FKLSGQPRLVAIDPDMAVLSRTTIHQSAQSWATQLELGPTWAARAQAIRALGTDSTPAGVSALMRVGRDAHADVHLREEAVKSLAARKATQALIHLTGTGRPPAELTIALAD